MSSGPLDPSGPQYQPPTYEAPTYQAPSYETPTYPAPAQPSYSDPTYPASAFPATAAPTPSQPVTTPYEAAPYQPAQYQAPQFPPPATPGGYPAGATPTPWSASAPPQRRGVGVGALIAFLVVTALVFSGVGFAAGRASRSSTTTASSTTGSATKAPTKTTQPTVAVIPPGDGAALRAHLITPPAGSKKLTTSGATDDVMSLDQFLKKYFDTDSTERGRLVSRKFEVAAQSEWVTKAGIEVHDQVVQFGSADGAQSYALGQESAYKTDGDWPQNFPIPGVTLGYGFEDPTLDADGNRLAVLMCQDGPFTVIEFFFTPTAFDRPSEIAVLQNQIAALAH